MRREVDGMEDFVSKEKEKKRVPCCEEYKTS
jgi:hypothetical protein